ncbi:MAG TPA: amino acid adenylation domain-containing protein, partial [Anaerolineae bacterium]|nr:amino acid adenylation domain-containing protein [Anaerolineae bacterium]
MAVVDDFEARREKLTPAKRALLDKRLRGEAWVVSAPIQPRSNQAWRPVSFTQERFWLVNQLDGADPRYNMSSIYRITGELDVARLQYALQAIVDRQAVLRTNFVAVQGVPQPIINDHAQINFQVFELTTLPPQEAETRSLQLIQQEIQRPFDLTRDVMLRAVLIKQSDGQFLLALIRHHIATDGWSTRIIQQELTALYLQANSLPVLATQYADYAAWQRAQFDQGAFEKDIAFWKQQLAGSLPILELPTDHPRPSLQTWRGASEYLMLPVDLVKRAREFSRRERLTLFMTLLASFDVLLYRYSAQADILVGTPVANRLHAETEKMIGPFFNMLVMRSRLSGDLSFRNLMSQVRDTTLTAYDHQRAPFEKIVEVIQPDRDLGHSPVFQVMFALQNIPPSPLNLVGLAVEEVEIDRGVAQYDLTLEISEQTDGLRCSIEYNTDLFEAGTISRMLGHYQNILAAAIVDPDRSIATLPLLTEAERRQLLIEWNLTAQAYPLDQCLQHLFQEQVKRTPDRLAVIFKDAHLTYAELNKRANRLAHYLIGCGVKPDDLVAIYFEPSLEMVVAILGTLKAGGAYVPLDPSNPARRRDLMLRDSGAKIILTQHRLAAQLLPNAGIILSLDADRSLFEDESGLDPMTVCRPENLAYVIYTSGSSGQPKGVMIEHRSVVNNAQYCIQMLGLRPNDRVLQFASISFDGSIEEIFPTLLSGAGLVLRPKELELNLKDFLDFVRVQHLTVLEPPTAFWHQLTQDMVEGSTQLPAAIRLLFVGGEKASAAVLAAWLKIEGERVRWLNGYGPTEATSSVITYEAFASLPSINPLTEVPIGRPDPNTQAYILDDLLQPVPVGVPGELHIGGVCLARGYLHQPALTTQK